MVERMNNIEQLRKRKNSLERRYTSWLIMESGLHFQSVIARKAGAFETSRGNKLRGIAYLCASLALGQMAENIDEYCLKAEEKYEKAVDKVWVLEWQEINKT